MEEKLISFTHLILTKHPCMTLKTKLLTSLSPPPQIPSNHQFISICSRHHRSLLYDCTSVYKIFPESPAPHDSFLRIGSIVILGNISNKCSKTFNARELRATCNA